MNDSKMKGIQFCVKNIFLPLDVRLFLYKSNKKDNGRIL